MPEFKIFYVLPAETWEVKTAPGSEPVAVFRTQEEARDYLDTLDRIEDHNKRATPRGESFW